MRTITPRMLLTLAAAGTLALAGCAEETGDTETPETVTQTAEPETTATTGPDAGIDPTTTAPAPTNGDTTAEATGPPTEETPDKEVPEEDLPYEPVGTEVTIAGEPATICIHGDGWGTNVWAGNANTSCEFVIATHEVLIEGLDPTRDNIRQHLQEEITVSSPVTGQNYELTCLQRGERLVTCTGGEEAAVHFY